MIRYRKPYCARHSSVSWNLMGGKSPLWVAKQHGHTITTMLKAYAAWTEGATPSDIQAIKREFRFFTGLRPSQEIALRVADFDIATGSLRVNKARVVGLDKDCTKTGEDRVITLCPRAIVILQHQLTSRAQLVRAGKIHHNHLFFKSNGEPIRNLQYPVRSMGEDVRQGADPALPQALLRAALLGQLGSGARKKPAVVARQHGHSITTMLRVYAAWAEGWWSRASLRSNWP